MKYFLYTLLILLILILALVWYLGVFSKYEVQTKETGPYTVAYKSHVGPYTKVGPIMDQVYKDLVAGDVNPALGYGQYFSNPKVTPKEELRSEVGSIIPESEVSKLDQTGEKYKVKTITKANRLVIEFPIKNMLSYIVGPMKVYPLMMKYMEANNLEWTEDMPSIEIYDIENKMITYGVELK